MSRDIVKKPVVLRVPPEGGYFKTGTGIDIHVRYDRPTPESLAVKMAEAMNQAYLAQEDYHALKEQAEREKSKIRELKHLREKLRMRDMLIAAGRPYEFRSRMDPMRTYTTEAVDGQLVQFKDNLNVIVQNAEVRRKKALEAKALADRLHHKIEELVKKQREAN